MSNPMTAISIGAHVVIPMKGWYGTVIEHDDLGEGLHDWYNVQVEDTVKFDIWLTREQIDEVTD